MSVNINHCLLVDAPQERCKYTSIILGTDDIEAMDKLKIKKHWGSFKSDVKSCCERAADFGADSIFFFCACFICGFASFSILFAHFLPVAGHGSSQTSPSTGKVTSSQFSIMYIGYIFLTVSQCCILLQEEISLLEINISRTK